MSMAAFLHSFTMPCHALWPSLTWGLPSVQQRTCAGAVFMHLRRMHQGTIHAAHQLPNLSQTIQAYNQPPQHPKSTCPLSAVVCTEPTIQPNHLLSAHTTNTCSQPPMQLTKRRHQDGVRRPQEGGGAHQPHRLPQEVHRLSLLASAGARAERARATAAADGPCRLTTQCPIAALVVCGPVWVPIVGSCERSGSTP